jgi:hypothetical protein
VIRKWVAATAFLLGGLLPAQSLRVYSEFRRIDPFGQIVEPDRRGRPREILSPALARNAFASFHIVVAAPAGKPFWLFVGQNPENAVTATVYKEIYRRYGKQWIPDSLVPVKLPYRAQLPDPEQSIDGQTAMCFWMDLWVDSDAVPGRVKVEPQVNVRQDWAVYPMEVRIISAFVPRPSSPVGTLPPVTSPSDAFALGPLKSYLCGVREVSGHAAPCIRAFIRRNAMQDITLARLLEKGNGRESVAAGILKPLGVAGQEAWCASPGTSNPLGPEWFLRARDFLYRSAIN